MNNDLRANNNDINEYVPSLLNPRSVKKQHGNLTSTQNSIVSRCSLSLKRCTSGLRVIKKPFNKTFPPNKENVTKSLIVNNYINSFTNNNNNDCTFDKNSLHFPHTPELQLDATGKENSQNIVNVTSNKTVKKHKVDEERSIGFSAIDDLITVRGVNNSSPFSFGELGPVTFNIDNENAHEDKSSKTELNVPDDDRSTIIVEVGVPVITVSFGLTNCDSVNVNTKAKIQKITVCRTGDDMNVNCDIQENSQTTVQSSQDNEVIETIDISSEDGSPPKKRHVAVNFEIKKKPTEDVTEDTKVLILNTDAIEKLSHVIVQPPNYKLVKRKTRKFKNRECDNGRVDLKGVKSLKQRRIDSYLVGGNVAVGGEDVSMSSVVAASVEALRYERPGASKSPRPRHASPRQAKISGCMSAQHRSAHSTRPRDALSGPASPRRGDSSPSRTPSEQQKPIPPHKIIAGTNFAVDAFSYGNIPNVRHYFLTHFHTDHYSGLRKTFNKNLFCSKITAELCVSRLGVNPQHIRVINVDDSVTIDGVEVTAIDANHCPGSLMLVFTLPTGRSVLHTGDFRASPYMESYPVFWNKHIHTVYLDTTYCNPRYDFPTQEQCLEMALHFLRQKKLALEKVGKKFASVLIVCGTYTIGKEKFFMGVAKRVGCNVWACPEKDKVLQAVEGRSFGTQPPHACQLHVVPMRDLTYEKLRKYLESQQGAFSEVVAFKPSGWENGKNCSVEKDGVTIHGIPYSEHSSFSEMVRFIKFLQPKQVIPTVDISGGLKAVQKYFPCPLVGKESTLQQTTLPDHYSIQHPQLVPAVT